MPDVGGDPDEDLPGAFPGTGLLRGLAAPLAGLSYQLVDGNSGHSLRSVTPTSLRTGPCNAGTLRRRRRATPICGACLRSRRACCSSSPHWRTGKWARSVNVGVPRRRRGGRGGMPAHRPLLRENYGRFGPSTRQQVRLAVAVVIGAAVVYGGSLLLRSRAGWSLDLPVNAIAVSFALFMPITYAIGVGLKAHHVIIWGALLHGRRGARLARCGPEQHRSRARGSRRHGERSLRPPPVRSHIRLGQGPGSRGQRCQSLGTS